MGISSKVINPQAAVLVWNYSDRINANGASSPHKIDEVIINSASLVSISTSKQKASPAGQFELRLAPTFNWIGRITPGSWCVILMSQNKRIPEIDNSKPGTADKELVKMLGRIDSVRAVIDVDQSTGARKSMYVVTGQDWGSVFDTTLYVDPILRNNLLDKDGAVGQSARLVFDNFLVDWFKSEVKIPTSTQTIAAVIKLWGSPLASLSGALDSLISSATNPIKLSELPMFSTSAQFKLPKEVAKYFNFGNAFETSVNFAQLIQIYAGKLKSYDKYGGDNAESYGIPNPISFYGANTFWQLLIDNSNPVINELVTDMRWEGDSAKLALYSRLRPFINRNNFDGSTQPEVSKNISKFKNVRRSIIPKEDVISINAGTNWRDKINFVEIRTAPSLVQETYESQIKLEAQIVDRLACEREGFKPLIATATYLPFSSGSAGAVSPLNAMQWKYLLKEWHFNTHIMLNGAVSFVGQNQYIAVGDNIMIDASVLGNSSINSFQAGSKGGAFLLAHIESVSHNFQIDPENGARTFVTTVQFVRGIISDKDGNMIGVAGGAAASAVSAAKSLISGALGLGGSGGGDPIDAALDGSANSLPLSNEKTKNVLGSSTPMDPDKNKLKGN